VGAGAGRAQAGRAS